MVPQKKLGNNLIFILSQPRAGSTLLQRILAEHPDIETSPESWIMLLPLYVSIPEQNAPKINTTSLAKRAGYEFINKMPRGQEDYYEGVRRMYTYLYECALDNTNKKFFMDKTPRYYLISPGLYRTFPQARYIILLRNPLAVLNSILNTWTIFSLYMYKEDLLEAPNLLISGQHIFGDNCLVVHYEELVENPNEEIKRICEWLGLDYHLEMLEYGRNSPNWDFGDKGAIYQNIRPDPKYSDKWIRDLQNPQTWRLANDYLNYLGKEIIEELGYSYEELNRLLKSRKYRTTNSWFNFSLQWWLNGPIKGNKMRHNLSRLARGFQKQGLFEIIFTGIRELLN